MFRLPVGLPACSQAVLSEEELVGVEQASVTAAEVSGSMMRIKLELEEKKRTVNMLQAALVRPELRHTVHMNRGSGSGSDGPPSSPPRQAQQRELTVRHVKETEKELSRNFQLQKEQYEATIQRHLTFIDQVGAPAARSQRRLSVLASCFPGGLTRAPCSFS